MPSYDYDLRRLQLTEAAMLHDLKEICKRNNIRFYLDSGTLLGAIRHQGFIPWDNDIDIAMPYEDYERFINLPAEEFGERYFIQNHKSEADYYRAYTRMRLNHSTMVYPWEKKYNVHHGVWIDIFPMVELNSGFEAKLKRWLVKVCNVLLMQDYFEATKENWLLDKGAGSTKRLELFYALVPRKLRENLYRLIMNRICKAKNKNSFAVIWCAITKILPKSIFEGVPAEAVFEGERYPIPPEYDKCLTILYRNYMQLPPEEERGTHECLIIDLEKDYSEYMEI